MKFKSQYQWRVLPAVGIEDVVKAEADGSDYERGAFEALDAGHKKLAEVVGLMAARMPDQAQQELAAALGWEPADDA